MLQFTNSSMHSNVVLLKTDIISGFCSLVAKVTFVVSSSKKLNIFIAV